MSTRRCDCCNMRIAFHVVVIPGDDQPRAFRLCGSCLDDAVDCGYLSGLGDAA